jgi:hypothetical protein
MVMQDQNFWRQPQSGGFAQGQNLADQGGTAGGMFDTVLGIYGARQGAKGNAEMLRRAQGPLYQQSMDASGRALSNAGSMDPKAAAAERFAAQQALLAGGDQASENELFRRLDKMGMLGASTYEGAGTDPVSGTKQSWGAGAGPVNPQMAAFYAARNQRNSQAAYDALNQGEAQIDRQLGRSSNLAQQAGALQNQGLQAQRTQVNPGAKKFNVVKGAASIAKDLGLGSSIGGMFKGAADWLGGATGLWGGSAPTGSYDSYGTGDFDLWYD